MSFDWKLYVDLADELIKHQRTSTLADAYFRSAVSRSYYGVFCVARSILESKGVILDQHKIHAQVRDAYNESPKRVEKAIGQKLGRLSRDRKNADYDANETFDTKRAETAHELARRTIRLLDGLTT